MAIINPNDLFNNVPNEKIHLNKFSLSYDNVHTTEGGRLTVASCFRVLPGETIEMSATPFVRTLPLVSPIFGKLDYFLHAFYVTNNTVSAKWKDYIRNGQSGEEQLKPDMLFYYRNTIPEDVQDEAAFYSEVSTSFDGIQFDNNMNGQHRPFFAHGSLADYLGLGSTNTVKFGEGETGDYIAIEKIPNTFKHSLIPFKCYQAIWAEYFADANVMTFDQMDTIDPEWLQYIDEVSINIDFENGNNSFVSHYVSNGTYNSDFVEQVEIFNLFRTRYRCYAKDYFTSCLPEPQRGPDVLIPIGANIDIVNDFDNPGGSAVMTDANYETNELDFLRLGIMGQGFVPGQLKPLVASETGSNSFNARLYNADQLRAEISSLTATITDLRTAVALQEFYESKARYGNRYKEFIYGSFGSMIPDNQLYRPWYLGGMRLPIQVSEVLQTANDQGSSIGVGTQFGRAVTGGSGFLFKRQFADYGTVMVIESIRPRNYYINNIDRTWTVDDSLDEYWRKLQGVGEQAVYNYELFGYFSDLSYNQLQETFGYQMRYSEYKQKQDEIHGDFKGSLSYWTIYRDFTNGAALNADFLQVMPEDINHIFQYSGNDIDHFLVNISFNIIREAPMDIYSIPRIS